MIKRRRDAEVNTHRHGKAYHGFKDFSQLRSAAMARNTAQGTFPNSNSNNNSMSKPSGDPTLGLSQREERANTKSISDPRYRSGSAGGKNNVNNISDNSKIQSSVTVQSGDSARGPLAKSIPSPNSSDSHVTSTQAQVPLSDGRKRTLPHSNQIQQQQQQQVMMKDASNPASKLASTSSFWQVTKEDLSEGDDDEVEPNDSALGNRAFCGFVADS